MSDNQENIQKDPEMEALYKRFEELLLGDSLSDEEKRALACEILKIVHGGEGEV